MLHIRFDMNVDVPKYFYFCSSYRMCFISDICIMFNFMFLDEIICAKTLYVTQ